jgi:hypothetical protein
MEVRSAASEARMTDIVQRLRGNIHYPDCKEFGAFENDYLEALESCGRDCVWQRLEEAAEVIEKLQSERRMDRLMARARKRRK